MNLVIVESPTKIKSLSKYLGKDYEVMASMGHLIDLPKSKMGIEIKKKESSFEFVPEYIVTRGKGGQVKKLKSAAKRADKIILATDPDREGEAIAWHVAGFLKDDKAKEGESKFQRITFHSITKEAILEAMKKPGEIDANLVNAQQARRVLDRLVGYKLSPVLWRKVRRGLSAGRVQSVALRMIVEREREIEAFVADEYWLVWVDAKTNGGEGMILELREMGGKKVTIKNGEQAKEIETDLQQAILVIKEVTKKERRSWPHPPFKTSTLQQAAANVLGWSSKKTMQVAQKLYEQGDITYHRTDSLNLATTAIDLVRGFIMKEFGDKYLPAQAIFYKTKGKVVAQEAHEAIRPTDMMVGSNSYKGKGKEALDQEKLYGLIWRRTIACQMVPAVFDATAIKVEAQAKNKYGLQVNGETIKFDGWRRLYKKEDGEIILPVVKEGEKLNNEGVRTEQKFTQPPARYNDASLVKELEKRGIGRPSTYASIISTIMNRGYVNRESRRFFATKIGMTVSDFLVANFAQEVDYDFTAKMEDGLDDIARGEKEWQKYLSDFYGPFEKTVADVEKNAKRIEIPVVKTGEKCPECKEGDVVIREGRFGRFLSCSRFPECKYTANFKEFLEGAICPDDGGRVVIKKTGRGREFFGCENYPNCKWASWKNPLKENEDGLEVMNKEEGNEKAAEESAAGEKD